VLEAIEPGRALTVFQQLSFETAASVLERLGDERARQILIDIEPARAAALLTRIEGEVRERLLQGLPERIAKELTELMSYTDEQAGSLMDPRVTTFLPETTVEQALARLREKKTRVDNVFLVDHEGFFSGAVVLQDIALAPQSTKLRQLVQPSPTSIKAIAPREELAEILDHYKLSSLPVVDFEERLIGVIRHQALFDAVEQDATADLQTMTGAGRDERALSKVSFAVRKRLPWLQINLATAFLAASVVGLFEDTIAKYTALAVLLPVVAGQSGNTGAQALGVTMRGLALREITLRHWLRVTIKEASVGFINGVAVAVVTMLGVYAWSGSLGLCMVIGVAMIMAMTIAGVAGAITPILLSAVGQDPAQSSSIVLTTVTDIFGFFSFLGLATLFSSML
jgi:magnesium transporter